METESTQILSSILTEANKQKQEGNQKGYELLVKSAIRFSRNGEISRLGVKKALETSFPQSRDVKEFLTLFH